MFLVLESIEKNQGAFQRLLTKCHISQMGTPNGRNTHQT